MKDSDVIDMLQDIDNYLKIAFRHKDFREVSFVLGKIAYYKKRLEVRKR